MADDTITEFDLRGYQCPLPVLKARNQLRKMEEGARVWVQTDDPLAVIDIPNFCNEYDQGLIEQKPGEGDSHLFLLERRGTLR